MKLFLPNIFQFVFCETFFQLKLSTTKSFSDGIVDDRQFTAPIEVVSEARKYLLTT